MRTCGITRPAAPSGRAPPGNVHQFTSNPLIFTASSVMYRVRPDDVVPLVEFHLIWMVCVPKVSVGLVQMTA